MRSILRWLLKNAHRVKYLAMEGDDQGSTYHAKHSGIFSKKRQCLLMPNAEVRVNQPQDKSRFEKRNVI